MPHVEAVYWSFMLGGLVDVPLCLSYNDLQAFPSTETECVIACAGNPPGGSLIGQGHWQGISMQHMLDEVTISPDAQYAHLFAADGYSTFIDLDQLRQSILVYGMNGDALPPEHGYPARLIVPGHYGYKMPKWIQRIMLADTPSDGLWEQRGWSQTGQIQTTAQITFPVDQSSLDGPVLLRGTAYAGDRAIMQVEISIDGGPWMPAPFTQPETGVLAQWAIEWTPHSQGEHHIAVRALDESGFVQAATTASSPLTNGSSGLHTIVVHV